MIGGKVNEMGKIHTNFLNKTKNLHLWKKCICMLIIGSDDSSALENGQDRYLLCHSLGTTSLSFPFSAEFCPFAKEKNENQN